MSTVGMLCEELRPLKRPKLGIPDLFPQEQKQKEVVFHSDQSDILLSIYMCIDICVYTRMYYVHVPLFLGRIDGFHAQLWFQAVPTFLR